VSGLPEGGTAGVTAAGPDNTEAGACPCPEVDGTSQMDIKANLRVTQPWKTGQGAPASSGFALGQPD